MEQADLFSDLAEGPTNGSAYWLKTEDGVRIRVAVWTPSKATNGTVLILPGRTDYIEQYGRTATELGEAGFATLVIDWRGQGLSDRLSDDPMKGHVNQFADYQLDLTAIKTAADELALPQPWFMLGHSMGGCIGLRSLLAGPSLAGCRLPVAACAFTAPMWQIHLAPALSKIAYPASWLLKTVGKAHMFAPGQTGETYVLREPFEGNTLTSDQDRYQYWLNLAQNLSAQQTGGPTVGWLHEALKEARVLAKLPSPDIPCIAFCGTEEEIVGVSAIADRMNKWAQGKFEMIPDARHELLMEAPTIRGDMITKICDLFKSAES